MVKLHSPTPNSSTETIIAAENLDFSYGDGTTALTNVNLDVKSGEFIALIGQNGSGKSTLLRLISGMEPGFSGKLEAFGMDLHRRSARRNMPHHLGYVFQNPEVQLFNRSVYEEVAYGPRNLGMPEEKVKPLVRNILREVGLTHKAEEDPIFLSRGQKRRLAVASVIAMGPKLIIVDEPTTGQDPTMSRGIMELLAELNRSGTTVIAVTHDIQLASEYCDRVVVMNNGTIDFDGMFADLFKDSALVKGTNVMVPQVARIGLALEKLGLVSGTVTRSSQLASLLDRKS